MGSSDETEQGKGADGDTDETLELTILPRYQSRGDDDGTVELTVARGPRALPGTRHDASPTHPEPVVNAPSAGASLGTPGEVATAMVEFVDATLDLGVSQRTDLAVLPFAVAARSSFQPAIAPASAPRAEAPHDDRAAGRVRDASRSGVARFAEIRALLDAGEPRAAVFATYDLNDARWRDEEESILSILADAAEQADLEKLGAYEDVYRATLREVARDEAIQADVSPRAASEPPPAPSNAAPTLVVGGLTMEEHAVLCAELAFDREHAAGALARFQLTPGLKAALDREWMKRLTDPKLAEAWHRANHAHTEALQARGRHAAAHTAMSPPAAHDSGEDRTLEVDVKALHAPLPFKKTQGDHGS